MAYCSSAILRFNFWLKETEKGVRACMTWGMPLEFEKYRGKSIKIEVLDLCY